MQMCLRSFLTALVAVFILGSAKQAEADNDPACEYGSPAWHFAGDHGIIETPPSVDLDSGKYFFLTEEMLEGRDSDVVIGRFWYICHHGFEIDATKWRVSIKFNYLVGYQVVVVEKDKIGELVGGSVLSCGNPVDCLKKASALVPQAFVRAQPTRQ